MHEHVGEQLVEPEIGCQKEVQSEQVVQVDARPSQHEIGGKGQRIDNEQILGYCRNISHDERSLIF